jgi:alkyl hydroperoxide reductase subunit F
VFESGASLKARTIILSTGARWRQMNVPGEDTYKNKGVAYCPHCDGPLYKGKRVAVIGGGNSGVEAAIDLAGIVAHVTLVEYDSDLRADAVLQRKLASLSNVRIITSALTTEVHGDGDRVTGLSYRDRNHDTMHQVELEGIFVQIGLVPNTEWLRDAIALTPRGEIEIDHRGHTSQPGIFAAGDATTVPFKQIVIAMGEGSKAGLSAFDYLIRMPPAAGRGLYVSHLCDGQRVVFGTNGAPVNADRLGVPGGSASVQSDPIGYPLRRSSAKHRTTHAVTALLPSLKGRGGGG